MAEYLWYVLLNGKQYGPYTFLELRGIKALTPDTLCWREGMAEWIAIRYVPELKDLFEEEKVPPPEEISLETPSEDLALTLPQSQPPYYLWLILLIIVIVYAFFQLYS